MSSTACRDCSLPLVRTTAAGGWRHAVGQPGGPFHVPNPNAEVTASDREWATNRLQEWLDSRDTGHVSVETFVATCYGSSAADLLGDVAEGYANETGEPFPATGRAAMLAVLADWVNGGFVCQVCEELVARTEVLQGGPQVVCEVHRDRLLELIEHDTKSQTLTMHRVLGGTF